MLTLLATLFLALPTPAEAISMASDAPAAAAPVADGWIAKKGDNICGLKDPKMLSNPAKVAYQQCLEATKHWKKMVSEGIDPDSPTGVSLRRKAREDVVKTCNKVMKKKSHCSVWKKISHEDGRAVTDLTKDVKKALPK